MTDLVIHIVLFVTQLAKGTYYTYSMLPSRVNYFLCRLKLPIVFPLNSLTFCKFSSTPALKWQKTQWNFGKDFFGILEIGSKNRKNFYQKYSFFLLKIERRLEQNFRKDFLFWQKNGTNFYSLLIYFSVERQHCWRVANFKIKKIHIAYENVNFNVSVMICSANGWKIAVF